MTYLCYKQSVFDMYRFRSFFYSLTQITLHIYDFMLGSNQFVHVVLLYANELNLNKKKCVTTQNVCYAVPSVFINLHNFRNHFFFQYLFASCINMVISSSYFGYFF